MKYYEITLKLCEEPLYLILIIRLYMLTHLFTSCKNFDSGILVISCKTLC